MLLPTSVHLLVGENCIFVTLSCRPHLQSHFQRICLVKKCLDTKSNFLIITNSMKYLSISISNHWLHGQWFWIFIDKTFTESKWSFCQGEIISSILSIWLWYLHNMMSTQSLLIPRNVWIQMWCYEYILLRFCVSRLVGYNLIRCYGNRIYLPLLLCIQTCTGIHSDKITLTFLQIVNHNFTKSIFHIHLKMLKQLQMHHS